MGLADDVRTEIDLALATTPAGRESLSGVDNPELSVEDAHETTRAWLHAVSDQLVVVAEVVDGLHRSVHDLLHRPPPS